MDKEKKLLPRLIPLLFILFSMVLLGALLYSWSVVTYLTNEMEHVIQSWLKETSKRGAAMTTAEELETYQTPKDMNLPSYQALRYKLADFSDDSNVLYVYYLRPLGDDIFQYIIDNDFDAATRVGLDTPPAEVALTPGMAEALSGQVSTTALGSYMQGWEGLLSAYAPLFNNEGQVAAVCGVDIDDRQIVSARQRARALGLFCVVAIVAVFASGVFCLVVFRNQSKILQNIVEERTKKIVRLQESILKTVSNLIESRDFVTGAHIERTQHCIRILIDEIKKQNLFREIIDDWDINLILQSAQLHDIGKISIGDFILNKPGPLTTAEYDEMKKHTVLGYKIIERIETDSGESELLSHAKIFALTHHEKWDGTGYPNGLQGHNIPLQGRIMAIADVYDALISERPYKKAFTHEEAVETIMNGKGVQFDPQLIDIFVKISNKLKL